MFHISTQHRGRQPHSVLCVEDVHSLVLKRLVWALDEVGPPHQENEIYQGEGERADCGITVTRSAVLPGGSVTLCDLGLAQGNALLPLPGEEEEPVPSGGTACWWCAHL